MVVDTTEVRKLNFGQISDYIAMIGLAQIDLDKDLRAAPSILNVFKDPDEQGPMEMCPWDKALLHALYSTPQRSKTQLPEMQVAALTEIRANSQ
jgi:hypothetical protein